MIIECISDLHGNYPKLEGGDLLIVAGDLTSKDDYQGYFDFNLWMINNSRIYKKCIVIAGNHDKGLLPGRFNVESLPNIVYLCDSGIEFEGLKIWGSPWTKWFPEVNPKCTAFMLKTEEELAEKWARIPNDTDILITHSPPYEIFDETLRGENVGSKSLEERTFFMTNYLDLHVFGHIHEQGCKKNERTQKCDNKYITVNASHVNEHYEPVNKSVRVIL